MKVTNTDTGPRGFWNGDSLVLLDPKQSYEGPLSAGDAKAAQATGYFDVEGADDDEPAKLPALTGKNKAELLAIAKEEGVEIGDGASNDDIRSAIELHRGA